MIPHSQKVKDCQESFRDSFTLIFIISLLLLLLQDRWVFAQPPPPHTAWFCQLTTMRWNISLQLPRYIAVWLPLGNGGILLCLCGGKTVVIDRQSIKIAIKKWSCCDYFIKISIVNLITVSIIQYEKKKKAIALIEIMPTDRSIEPVAYMQPPMYSAEMTEQTDRQTEVVVICLLQQPSDPRSLKASKGSNKTSTKLKLLKFIGFVELISSSFFPSFCPSFANADDRSMPPPPLYFSILFSFLIFNLVFVVHFTFAQAVLGHFDDRCFVAVLLTSSSSILLLHHSPPLSLVFTRSIAFGSTMMISSTAPNPVYTIYILT